MFGRKFTIFLWSIDDFRLWGDKFINVLTPTNGFIVTFKFKRSLLSVTDQHGTYEMENIHQMQIHPLHSFMHRFAKVWAKCLFVLNTTCRHILEHSKLQSLHTMDFLIDGFAESQNALLKRNDQTDVWPTSSTQDELNYHWNTVTMVTTGSYHRTGQSYHAYLLLNGVYFKVNNYNISSSV